MTSQLIAPDAGRPAASWSHIWSRPGQFRRPLPCQCHPVDLAQPDRADARGRPSTELPADLDKLRPRSAAW
ncbi:hypothetical protein PSU4_06670 [Pseudonocardia sulfidoxydans NBRC 16205]|uniref:Uncharacterized protein n=1 Tax=Pseudonocardia sulfidoxydans NBRC 16205 TaxID=1223511 RepID=A0A511DBE6_9PSEU|nr:hypothetical protein PSU4_06670 [Pseudonocardia sulfidoxydans NBRC 16205]